MNRSDLLYLGQGCLQYTAQRLNCHFALGAGMLQNSEKTLANKF